MKGKRDKGTSVKKPIFKKWWFWVIIVVLISCIFGDTDGGDTDEGTNTSSTSAGIEASSQLDETQPAETAGTEANLQLDETQPAETAGTEANPQLDETQPAETAGTEASPQLDETQPTETAEGNNAEAAEEPSNEDAIRKAIEDVVGEENLETFNYVPDNNFSLIRFKGTSGWTNKTTVRSMYLDMFNILKAIQSIIDTDVAFNVVYPLQDKYGNVSDEIVIKATFTNNTIQKINFKNALFGNIPDLADEWWNHNAVNINE